MVISKLGSRVLAHKPLLQTPHFIVTTVQDGGTTVLKIWKLRLEKVI